MKTLRIALAQMNPTVGDLDGNVKKIAAYIGKARRAGADLVAFPELAVTGYPPEDLLLKPSFINDAMKSLDKVRLASEGMISVVGFVERADDLYNSAAVISDKKLIDVYRKQYLPNYGPFDEIRYFQAGLRTPVYRVGEVLMGVNICEDMWHPGGPAHLQALAGAELLLNISSSPYTIGKAALRESMFETRATDSQASVVMLNAVGGQDELVFDGSSFIVNERGEVVARARTFEEDLLLCDLDLEVVFMRRLHDPRRRQEVLALEPGDVDMVEVPLPKKKGKAPAGKKTVKRRVEPRPEGEEEVYNALVLGVRDYIHKNRFRGGLIGLSGGIDSALVAAIAVDALGVKNIRCLFMPSRYTSKESREDSFALAKNLGVELTEIPIDPVFETYLETLKAPFKGMKPDTTEENLQARIRGNLLMAFSNKLGHIVLTTGNKSEMSVGYATLYGDMAGGFAVIKDVPKTLAYRLAEWYNVRAGKEIIPKRIITKPPTAELRADQKDTDSLPPYDVLDPILERYIEEEKSLEEIIAFGTCDPACAKKAVRLVDINEYKRRQAPPGIKITPRAFGKDRRFPITNRYRRD
jgi:NAD+ synthase (glutamine-hydrolysing)